MNRTEKKKLEASEDKYRSKLSPFQKWFTVFLEEKEVDLSEYVQAGDGSCLQIGDICSAIMVAPENEQKQIKDTLVLIDYKNGDVNHYFEHLAKALNKQDKLGI